MIVELAGDAPGPNRRLYDRHRDGLRHIEGVSFPLPEGLPAGSWLLLRRGSEWIDRRFLSVPWGRGREAGVEVVVEAATRLESLVSAGERQLVEFKRQIPKEDETKAKIMKTVCAFANGQGGSLLIGVDDERNIVGLDPRSVDQVRDQVTQMVGSWVEPRPPTDFNLLPIADSENVVLELVVGAGTELYASGRPGEVRTVYVRHHGVTERARIADIKAIVLSRNAASATSPWLPHTY